MSRLAGNLAAVATALALGWTTGLVAPELAAGQNPAAPKVEIPDSATDLPQPEFIGSPATPKPIKMRGRIPEHPFMAPNGQSNLHNDPFQTDTYGVAGPLGRNIEKTSTLYFRECASVAFDSQGRIVTICVGLDRPVLAILDPVTLETLAAMPLPPRGASGGNPFTDFSGGGYFYLDNRDRAILTTSEHELLVVGQTPGPGLEVETRIDLSGSMADDDKIISALPDWKGRVWFATVGGVVGFADLETAKIAELGLREPIGNSFAVGQGGGVFIVSDEALYRFEAKRGQVDVVWRHRYANDGEVKSGQTQAGSGTTPTLIKRRWIAITNNSDPVEVLVYKRKRSVSGRRLLCRNPIFEAGASSTDQSLVAFNRSIVAENNHGYEGPTSMENGNTATGGLDRIDIRRPSKLGRDPDENCRLRWHSDEIAPSVVPKVSLGNGLLYTYTKPDGTATSDPWYFTALDFRTGRTVYKQLSGLGLGFNNNYAPVTIGPDGAAYVGVLGGLTRFSDG